MGPRGTARIDQDAAAFDAAMDEEAQHPVGASKGRPRLGVIECRIELRPAAARALRRVEPPVRCRLQGAIALLAGDPRPRAARALKGRLRIRLGDYRIIDAIDEDVLLVAVVTQGRRRRVYDR